MNTRFPRISVGESDKSHTSSEQWVSYRRPGLPEGLEFFWDPGHPGIGSSRGSTRGAGSRDTVSTYVGVAVVGTLRGVGSDLVSIHTGVGSGRFDTRKYDRTPTHTGQTN